MIQKDKMKIMVTGNNSIHPLEKVSIKFFKACQQIELVKGLFVIVLLTMMFVNDIAGITFNIAVHS
jgi:hypothetical protein